MKNLTFVIAFFFGICLIITGITPAGAVEFQSSNLPVIVIDTQGQFIPNEPKITADMGIIYNGPGKRNYLTDPFNEYDGKIGIETRGSSTQMFPKKQYAVETRDAAGENLNVPLLGLPKENDWILNGPYSDKSLLRNVLAFYLYREMGRYGSRWVPCELVLNGDYQGVYILLEKIKRDKNRVNIAELEYDDVSGDAVTGGYIIKIDKTDGANTEGWNSAYPPYSGAWQRIYYQYHDPKFDELVPEQRAYIQNFIHEFETTMNSAGFADPQSGYPHYIDVASFVDYFILTEVTRNVDGYRLSTFLYKDRDSKNPRIILGPPWDYNLAFGNADYYNGASITGWQINFLVESDNFQIPFWMKKLWKNPDFANQLKCRWSQLRQSTLSVSRLNNFIDSLVTQLDEAQSRNFERWPILNQYIWPNAYVGGSYLAEILYLKDWLQKRILWMDGNLPGTCVNAVPSQSQKLPESLHLFQNYPNPFNNSTIIKFNLPEAANVNISIYDVQGRLVRNLASGFEAPGEKQVYWDATDAQNRTVGSGIYICRMKVGQFKQYRRLLFLK